MLTITQGRCGWVWVGEWVGGRVGDWVGVGVGVGANGFCCLSISSVPVDAQRVILGKEQHRALY